MCHHADCSYFHSPSNHNWIKGCYQLGKDQIGPEFSPHRFDETLGLLNIQYQSEHYATWLDTLSRQTPSDHPDKQHLLLAAEFHQDSMLRSKSIEDAEHITTRSEIRQIALAQRFGGGSLLSQAFGDPGHRVDIGPEDTDFTELRDEFRDDHLRLEAVSQDLERYCEHTKQFRGGLKSCISEIFPFMTIFSSTAYPSMQSKWLRFFTEYHQSPDDDLHAILESYVR